MMTLPGTQISVHKVGTRDFDSCALSRDGRMLIAGISVAQGTVVKVYDTTDWTYFYLEDISGWIDACAISPDGKKIAAQGGDGMIHIWDAATRKKHRVIRSYHYGRMGLLCEFSPDSRRLITGQKFSQNPFTIWDSHSGEPLANLQGNIWNQPFSPDGRHILVTVPQGRENAGGVVALDWETGSGRVILREDDHLLAASYSPDGRKLFTLSTEGRAAIWDLPTMTKVSLNEKHYMGLAFDFSPDSEQLVTSSGTDAFVWNTATGEMQLLLQEHKGGIFYCAFFPDGSKLLTASAERDFILWHSKIQG